MNEEIFQPNNQNKKPKKKSVKRKKDSDNFLKTLLEPKPQAAKANAKARSEKAPDKKNKPYSLYSKIAISFVILTILLIAVISYLSLVKVSITLIPNQESIAGNLTADIYDQDKIKTPDEGAITGVVKQVEVEQSKTYPASGKQVLGEEVTGKVTIVNDYNKNQPLVATTRLLSADNKLYRIKNTVNVPAGGQAEVEIYADDSKQEMAIGPTKFTIPGLWAGLQDKIYGQSKEPFVYNQKAKISISQSDIDNAVKDLKKNLLVRAKEDIGNAYKSYDQVLYEIDNNSISQQLDSKVGEEKNSFILNLKTKVNVVAFKTDKIFEMAKQKLLSSLPDDKQLIEFDQKNINYNLGSYNISQGIASLNATFKGKMAMESNAKVIDKNKLVGLTSEQLKQYLNSLPEIAGYEVKFFPSFIQKMPNLIDRINIEIKK